MLKHILLAGGMMIAAPALAQTSTGTPQTQPGAAATTAAPAPTASTAPTGDAITAQTSPATPAPTAPADPVVADGATQPATPAAAAPAQSAPAQSAQATTPAQPAAANGSGQVQQIVSREFGSYDKNGDGKLSQGEFDAWMVALKTASDPATKADSAETKQWLGAAFAQADADKSRDLTQAELTGFLSQGQS